jgi:DivIVA domain-containing protein
MTTEQDVPTNDRGLTPADLHNVRFTRASMLRPGYVDSEVDRVLSRVAEELGRVYAEKAALRDQVRSLQAQLDGVVIPEAPSDQAVRILSSAQLTADNYVAEAEEFSRQVSAEARTQYEEVLREARETAGAILQSAQEAAARRGPAASGEDERDLEALQEQVAYLKAFGQATRTQLRAYLEALLVDVEKEWGRADPAALPSAASLPPAPRQGSTPGTTFEGNSVAGPAEEAVDVDVAHVVSVRE